MITFATVQNPDVKFIKIPPVIDSNHRFIVYASDEPVGITYGSYCGKLEVHLPNGKKVEYTVDELKRIHKRNIKAVDFLKFGQFR